MQQLAVSASFSCSFPRVFIRAMNLKEAILLSFTAPPSYWPPLSYSLQHDDVGLIDQRGVINEFTGDFPVCNWKLEAYSGTVKPQYLHVACT